jgi:hypothetical protein
LKVSIEKQSDGTYIAYNTTGEKVTIIGTGDTVKEAKEDFFNSIEEVKASYGPDEVIPGCLSEPIDFQFNTSSD